MNIITTSLEVKCKYCGKVFCVYNAELCEQGCEYCDDYYDKTGTCDCGADVYVTADGWEMWEKDGKDGWEGYDKEMLDRYYLEREKQGGEG